MEARHLAAGAAALLLASASLVAASSVRAATTAICVAEGQQLTVFTGSAALRIVVGADGSFTVLEGASGSGVPLACEGGTTTPSLATVTTVVVSGSESADDVTIDQSAATAASGVGAVRWEVALDVPTTGEAPQDADRLSWLGPVSEGRRVTFQRSGGLTLAAGTEVPVSRISGVDAWTFVFGSAADILDAGFLGQGRIVAAAMGGGDDRFVAAVGDDVADGGPGADILSYERSTAGVSIRLSMQSVVAPLETGGSGRDLVTGFENLLGSDTDDQLEGDASVNTINGLGGADVIDSGEASDVIVGGAGDDTLIAGADAAGDDRDLVSYAFAPVGVRVDLARIDPQDTGWGIDTLVGFNDVVGSKQADLLLGTVGANRIFGGEGDDRIAGHGGRDELHGDGGVDTLDASTWSRGANVWLRISGKPYGQLQMGTLWSWLWDIESVIGGSGPDMIKGSPANNVLRGGGGADRLFGQAGDDRLLGGAGRDSLVGGEGTDACLPGGGRTLRLEECES